MRLHINLTMAGGEKVTTTAIVADFIAWEKQTKKKISDLAEGASMSDMALLAHLSLKRQDSATPDFDKWVEQIDTLEAGEPDDPKVSKKVR